MGDGCGGVGVVGVVGGMKELMECWEWGMEVGGFEILGPASSTPSTHPPTPHTHHPHHPLSITHPQTTHHPSPTAHHQPPKEEGRDILDPSKRFRLDGLGQAPGRIVFSTIRS